jgi:hypothetical protein
MDTTTDQTDRLVHIKNYCSQVLEMQSIHKNCSRVLLKHIGQTTRGSGQDLHLLRL